MWDTLLRTILAPFSLYWPGSSGQVLCDDQTELGWADLRVLSERND
jgi:hypothetical protein